MPYLPSLTAYANRLQSFDFEHEAIKVIGDNTHTIEDLQRKQLEEGKDSNGDYIKLKDNFAFGFGYRPFTVNEKLSYGKGVGAITGHVTWFMTGELHRSLKESVQGLKVVLSSDNINFQSLLSRSGEEAVGLNPTSLEVMRDEVIRPDIEVSYKSKVGRL